MRGDTPARLFLFQRLAEILAGRAGAATRILDIGCGEGLPWKANRTLLSSTGSILTGVDNDPTALRRFADEFHAAGVQCDAADVQRRLAGASFDLVVSFNCLQYVHRLDALLAGVRAVLSPGSLFLIVLGNTAPRFWRELSVGSLRSQVGWWVTSRSGCRRYSVRSLARAAGRAGLDVVQVRHLTTARAKRLLNEMRDTRSRHEAVSNFLASEIEAAGSGRATPGDFVEMFVECRSR